MGCLAWFLASVAACGGVVESDAGSAGSGGSSAGPQFACPICGNAKLSCVVNGNTDTLVRAATSKTGCAFDFDSSAFSIDCDSQTFCVGGIGCAKYSVSGRAISVNSTFGRVSCAPSKG